MNTIRRGMCLLTVLSLAAVGACSTPENRQSAQGSQTAGAVIDDSVITTSIKASLLKDQALKSFDIHVETNNNVVQLTGVVDSPVQKTDAQRIAENVKGVKNVKNDILVQSRSSADESQSTNSFAADASITASVKASLLKDQAMKSFDIHVETSNGVVHLTGVVDASVQKADAQRIAENVKGMKSVKNDIVVR